jgi:hypothetical protein
MIPRHMPRHRHDRNVTVLALGQIGAAQWAAQLANVGRLRRSAHCVLLRAMEKLIVPTLLAYVVAAIAWAVLVAPLMQ